MTPEVTRAPFILVAPPAPPPKEPDNFYFYGYRDVCRTLPDGTSVWEQVSLTLADVLHPQEGDHITERPLQRDECAYLIAVFRSRLDRVRGGHVFSDNLINWGVPGQRNTAPDVAVLQHLNRPPNLRDGVFDVVDYGAEPLFVIELVSPHTRSNDVVDKPPEYHAAGIPLYVLVDEVRVGALRQLLAYRRTPTGYQLLPPERDGRVSLPLLGLKLGLRDEQVYCYDAVTGNEVGDYTEIMESMLAAREELRAEALARQEAEKARQEAEAARLLAEDRLRELEAELHRLRGQTNPEP